MEVTLRKPKMGDLFEGNDGAVYKVSSVLFGQVSYRPFLGHFPDGGGHKLGVLKTLPEDQFTALVKRWMNGKPIEQG